MSTPSPDHRAESEPPGGEPTGPQSDAPIDSSAPTGEVPAPSDVSGGSDAQARTDDDTESTAVRRKGFLGLHHDDAADAAPDADDQPVDTSRAANRTHTGTAAGGGDAGVGAAAGATAGVRGAGPGDARRSGTTRGSSALTPDSAGDGAALRERRRDQPEPTTDVLLDGATQAAPRSRAAAHVWALILSVVLVPIAWYLVADAGARLTLGQDSPWETGTLNPAAVVELVAGLIVVAAVLLLARWSSLGAIVTGVLVLLAGLAFVVVPGPTRELLEPAVEWLRDFNDLGRNLAHHLTQDGPAGRIALYGLALLMVGVVSHGARRLGRSEERAREAYARREQRTSLHRDGRA